MKRRTLLAIGLVTVLSGCRDTPPEPKSVAASAHVQNSLSVKHLTRGNEVLVECIATGVTFTDQQKGATAGKIVIRSATANVYEEHRTAAFIIKGMPKGTHLIELDVVGMDNKSLGMKKKFYVTIS
ncbi:hypothetical protein [Rossellomorea marisflavi]|uniref:hypothetical protein n=1 Tax=Rossellomorea marisflavi TaxID=189381 RepID=UPI00064F1257|nr:hypothetical protein [Rossellomorea marisflavi]KMK96625.1 hypothetical protein VL03_03245 [Rossellomorea marisflavi]KML06335.1 hypothetical protein VL06_09535 [Rossellomorea marisflavi]KML32721.1 hypothetical protein VL12_12985 [Rossellomorea marisflavi]MCM2603605.1 hypothetical protein [Rossellomorea marisflavi]USK93975.1 hypothetical protein LIT29_09660 [Rossellomorea marisflavi]